MTKHIFVSFLMIVAAVVSIQAQGLQPRHTLGNRLARPVAVDSITNDADRALTNERLLWKSWPMKMADEDLLKIYERSEELHKCVYVWPRMNWKKSWSVGCGKSCIILGDGPILGNQGVVVEQKIDSDGRIVWIGDSLANDLPELKWVEAEAEKALEPEREKWAKTHGMTLKEAKDGLAKWNKQCNPFSRVFVPNAGRISGESRLSLAIKKRDQCMPGQQKKFSGHEDGGSEKEAK